MSFIAKIDKILFNLGYMDLLSYKDSPIHKLNPVAKFITSFFYLLFVVSFDRYEISMLIPFMLYPFFLISRADLPFFYILKKVLYVSPFVLMVAVFNPVFDREILFSYSGVGITGGWISFFSIIIKFFLTVTTIVALIACTGLYNICYAMNRLGVPRVFSVQLLFLYRYIFLIAEETARMIRGRDLRNFSNKGSSIKVYGPFVGHLLLRSINRAERIYRSMVARGFDGNIHTSVEFSFGLRDLFFIFLWVFFFCLFRFFDIPDLIGKLALRVFL